MSFGAVSDAWNLYEFWRRCAIIDPCSGTTISIIAFVKLFECLRGFLEVFWGLFVGVRIKNADEAIPYPYNRAIASSFYGDVRIKQHNKYRIIRTWKDYDIRKRHFVRIERAYNAKFIRKARDGLQMNKEK